MRLMVIVASLLVFSAGTTLAQSEREMQLQRCVWSCLSQSSGNTDPAYHACVAERCAGTDRAAALAPPATGPDRETIRFVQSRLAELGFDPGPPDGIDGDRTRAAVRAYQRANGLPESGAITADIVGRLRAAPLAPGPASSNGAESGSAAGLDVPVLEHGGDGQMANCASSVVDGLNPAGDGFLAVRSGPGTEYRKIDELQNGSVVYTFDRRGAWVGIVYDVPSIECASTTTRPVPYATKGWVHGRWLRDRAG